MSINGSYNLDLGDLRRLKRELTKYKTKVDKLAVSSVKALVRTGEKALLSNIANIPNSDGNDMGFVESGFFGFEGQVSHIGPQVIFIEFGTGLPGLSYQHPKSGEAGYEYNVYRTPSAHRTRSVDGLEGWWYRDASTGKGVFTPGIRGEWQVFNTAMYLRSISNLVVKGVLEGTIK